MTAKIGMRHLRGQAGPKIQAEQEGQEVDGHSRFVVLECELAGHGHVRSVVRHQTGVSLREAFQLAQDICVSST